MASARATLPSEIWARILSSLSFQDASRGRLICKACNDLVRNFDHVDLSECKGLLKTELMLLRSRGVTKKLTVPMVRFLEDFRLLGSFRRIHMTGYEVPLEDMLTKVPKSAIHSGQLTHLTITDAAFVKSASRPNGTCEDYFTFDVSALASAASLQTFHIHFARIVQAVSRYDTSCGAWLSGLECCHARDVRVQVQSPPFTSVMDDLPPYGAGGGLRDRMAFLVRIPSRVHHFYVLTDCVVWLSRPIGEKYDPSPYSGQDAWEADPAPIFNLCVLSVRRPSCEIPNTQIRRVYPNTSATLRRPLVCITSRSTPDDIYADNLRRHAPGHCDLENAEEIAQDSWDDE